MKKLKKQISLVSFQRLLKNNSYIVCSSNSLPIKKKFISNYIFKHLYIRLFPTNFINSSILNSKLTGFTNNFLVFSVFNTKNHLLLFYKKLEILSKSKIAFIKINNLYFRTTNNFFLKTLNINVMLLDLNWLLNFLSSLFLIIKHINR